MTRIRFDTTEVHSQFRDALREHHLELSQELIADGEIHRCNAANKIGHSGRDDGAYLLRLTGNIPSGWLQNWTEDRDPVRWHFNPGRNLTSAERHELEREAAENARAYRRYLEKVREEARKKAVRMWDHASKASADHPYCRRKHIKPKGERMWRFKNGDNPLLIPFYCNATNEIVNLQFIPAQKDAKKKVLTGGRQSDCHYWICKPDEGDVDIIIYVVEGWATGVSVYTATKQAVIMSFGDKHLEATARWVREHYPHNQIVVCADDDWKLPHNPGLRYAQEAARAVAGLVAIPKFEDRERKETDFNDMHCAHGLEDVRATLLAAAADPAAPHSAEASATITAWELNQMKFPPLKYIVPDLIAEGLTIFAGKPKIGKSWLTLQVGNAVANGGVTLGGIRCKQGDVFYAALEDNRRRLQGRLDKLQIENWSKRLYLRCELPRLDEGGLDIIREWLEAAAKPRLVVIDTFKRVRSRMGTRETQYDSDYEAMEDLHALAQRYHIAIVVTHHQRKMDADDPYDTVSGTLGLTAAADTIMLLHTDRNGTLVLRAKGRDVEEIEKAMSFAKDTGRWKIAGEVRDVRLTQERAKVTQAMAAIGQPAKPAVIAAEAQMKTANVSKLLVKMARDQLVHRHGYGEYGLEPPPFAATRAESEEAGATREDAGRTHSVH
jgi:phage/plasmid primase-like uncharacterized protein